jgi:hypothetical protein
VGRRPPLLLVQPVQNVALIEHAYEHNQAGRRIPYAAPAETAHCVSAR